MPHIPGGVSRRPGPAPYLRRFPLCHRNARLTGGTPLAPDRVGGGSRPEGRFRLASPPQVLLCVASNAIEISQLVDGVLATSALCIAYTLCIAYNIAAASVLHETLARSHAAIGERSTTALSRRWRPRCWRGRPSADEPTSMYGLVAWSMRALWTSTRARRRRGLGFLECCDGEASADSSVVVGASACRVRGGHARCRCGRVAQRAGSARGRNSSYRPARSCRKLGRGLQAPRGRRRCHRRCGAGVV
jgi:hypothetical protein